MAVSSLSVAGAYEVLAVDVILESSKVRFIVVYCALSCKSEQNRQLSTSVSDILECDHPRVLLGDFDYPDIYWRAPQKSTSADSHIFAEMVRSHNLEQLVKKPTRSSHVPDLLFSSKKSLINEVSVGPPVGLSDHNCVEFKLCCSYVEPSYTYCRQFSKCDYNEVCRFLASIA